MSNFNNEEYECLVTDLIGDVFYTESSYRGKISTIRQYTEVIVRKLFDIEPASQITLGQKDIQNKIKTFPNHKFIEKAVRNILNDGNLTTHTQYLETLSKEDFENIVDSLFDMLSFLLITYFEKYEFGSRNDIMHSFSLLPPIIRYKVLIFLYEKYPDNISIIDKLVLAIMKALSVEDATKWVEEKRDILIQMGTMTEKAYNELTKNVEPDVAMAIQATAPKSMYHLCKEKIDLVGKDIRAKGLLYSNFENALPYYKQNGILDGDEQEIIDFNDIMSFLYLGRKETLEKVSKEDNPFVVMNFII